MIIYKDAISGDEMFTDAYPVKVVDDIVYEVEGKLVQETLGVDDALLGANPAEGGGDGDEGVDDTTVSGCNIVLANRLKETGFDKKSYTAYMKGYMKTVKTRLAESNPDRVEPFVGAAQKKFKEILGSFKDWQFFTGESMNPDGAVGLLNFREDGTTPYMVFFKDGLEEEKQ